MSIESPTEPGSGTAHWFRAMATGIGVLAASGIAAAAGNILIRTRFPDRPAPPDLLFDLLPHWPSTQFVVEALYIGGAVLLGVYALRPARRREIPTIIALFGLMELFRAVIMVLTPLAPPYDEATHFNVGDIRNWGEFPSGHAATMLLFYLIVDRADAPRIKRALGWMLAAECVFLVTSHSHYSIDIVGGLLLGYFVFWEYVRGRLFDRLKPLLKV